MGLSPPDAPDSPDAYQTACMRRVMSSMADKHDSGALPENGEKEWNLPLGRRPSAACSEYSGQHLTLSALVGVANYPTRVPVYVSRT